MKKLLSIIFVSLLFSGNAYTEDKWQKEWSYEELNGVWKINQPMDSFLNESKSNHNFIDEEIYFFRGLIGFAKSDRICRLNSTERVNITSENRKKFGIKGSAIIVHPTNCKDNEKKFGFDNIFIANKGSLVLFQYTTNFEKMLTFDFIREGGPDLFKTAFERDDVKFVKINHVIKKIDEKKFLGQFKHKFADVE
tara:strand:+ start:69 stop:650 length:582 start_codon:yes stop_codon:yes gene_type:complete